jgi:serine phosphatase RsbU (regulator of sigma subunit)
VLEMPSTGSPSVFEELTPLLEAETREQFFVQLGLLLERAGIEWFSLVTTLPGSADGALEVAYSSHPEVTRRLPESDEQGLPGSRPRGRPARVAGGSLTMDDAVVPVLEERALATSTGTIGRILVHSRPSMPDSSGAGLLESEAALRQIGAALRRTETEWRLRHQLDRSQAKLEAINLIGEIIRGLDLEVVLAKLMEISLFLTSAQVGMIALRGEGKELHSGLEWGLSLDHVLGLRKVSGRSILEETLASGEAHFVPDFRDSAQFVAPQDLTVWSFMCVPLHGTGRTLGAINLVNSVSDSGQFTETELDTIHTVAGLAATAIENAVLHRESLERERITAQLRVAQTIQQGLYPKQRPQIEGLEIAWYHASCDETGGDYFDFIQSADRRYLDVVIGDVSGHGIGSSLLMATGRASLRALLGSSDARLEPVVSILNDLLDRDMDESHVMTLFLGRLDLSTFDLTYVNAGHDQPALFCASRDAVLELGSTGMPLGLFPASAFSASRAGPMASGDVLLLTTDGVWEAANSRGERYGKERLLEHVRSMIDVPADELLERLRADVVRFAGAETFHDDFTMVALKRV